MLKGMQARVVEWELGGKFLWIWLGFLVILTALEGVRAAGETCPEHIQREIFILARSGVI